MTPDVDLLPIPGDRPLFPLSDSRDAQVDAIEPVQAFGWWPTNGHLIEAIARLGYLHRGQATLDPTYGMGVFWQRFKPNDLTACDLDPDKSPLGRSIDFTAMPFMDETFAAVVYDPPYKLNGRPDPIEERYGTHVRTRWQERVELMLEGLVECARVLRVGGVLVVKCKDQVVSGHMVWQSDLLTETGRKVGLKKIDRFDMLGHDRKQPPGRTQMHAYGRGSIALIFRKKS